MTSSRAGESGRAKQRRNHSQASTEAENTLNIASISIKSQEDVQEQGAGRKSVGGREEEEEEEKYRESSKVKSGRSKLISEKSYLRRPVWETGLGRIILDPPSSLSWEPGPGSCGPLEGAGGLGNTW